MNANASRIVIVGAGVCGLGIGWRLAQAGRAVTVIDRAKAGRAASWAAAGMLAPQVESEPGEEALLPLLLASRDMWADFAAELERASGIAVGYRTEGTMVVALDRDDRENLKFRYDYLIGLGGLDLEWLSGPEARRREPHLARGVTAAVASPLDHQVDNRKVAEALAAAFRGAGGTLIEDCAVEELLHDGTRVTGVRTATGTVAAETVVLAAGAWSRNIGGVPDSARPPVRPVKGQMLALQMDPAAPLTERVIWGPDCYIVPRRDGRLVVGATVEEMGFDTSLTGGGVFELLRAAWETLPGIYDLPLVESWAGLRPTARDDAPILGTTSIEGLVLATGHHRNGILLTPITAETVSRLVLDGTPPAAIRPFSLDRFARGRDDRSAA